MKRGKSGKVKSNPSIYSPLNIKASTSDSQNLEAEAVKKQDAALSSLSTHNGLDDSPVDNSIYAQAQIRAVFYPKFDNEKSDHEVRTRMTELVSKGLATLEVSLKHSGSLFMYAGHNGGAYAKNSFGNMYTAVGIFVLGRMFKEAWGPKANRKQAKFNKFLENNRMCISMELVTAVLGDHGQRPREDYVVVTAVTELVNNKPRFQSTPEIIAFCRQWRLPTNHVWLFSTRQSVTSFFSAYDALYEEGTATPVCKVLDEIADISVPGSKDHIKVQGEILEGLVARIASRDSSSLMEKVLRDYPLPLIQDLSVSGDSGLDLDQNLRDICTENRSEEKQIKEILKSVGTSFCPDTVDWIEKESIETHSSSADKLVVAKFLQARPADYTTAKVQEMIQLMTEKRLNVKFKCYHNKYKLDSVLIDDLHYKMVIHAYSDSVFQEYQKAMRHINGLWPLYRGFFMDISLFKANDKRAAEIRKSKIGSIDDVNHSNVTFDADKDANLMIKLKFLTYKLRTFLIRNGLAILFKEGSAAYKVYYTRQMKKWGVSSEKQKEMSKMLDEWAVYAKKKCGNEQISGNIYLSEAEPFLEKYAKRSAANQALIGSTGNFVSSEDFLAIANGLDEEGGHEKECEVASLVPQDEGLIVFFPGIPGCAKSALCKELINNPASLEDDRPVQTLMGDLVKAKYWKKIAEERRKKPYSIMLADKNAPNELVWKSIEEMCLQTKSSAIPVVPESEGTDSNPFSLDALATFMFRVLQRTNHPGKLDKTNPTAGYVLLMFYHLYEGKNRTEFEGELIEIFGSLVKMPLLRSDRNPLPDDLKSVLEDGVNLYRLHSKQHGKFDSTKGAYAKEWPMWEKKVRDTLSRHDEYMKSIQVPFEFSVSKVLEQLKAVAKGDHTAPSTKRRKLCIVYAAITLPVDEILSALDRLSEKNSAIKAFVKKKRLRETLRDAHITLAHKRIHHITAVASYGQFLNRKVPVELATLLFTDKMAALGARLGSVDGQGLESKNEWPHVTIWTEGVAHSKSNDLPQLHLQGHATRVELHPPIEIEGEVEFF